MKLLELRGLEAGYGGGPVLKGLDLTVEEGEIVALLGSNGAGKSTTLRAISGLVPQVKGGIEFAGKSLAGLHAEAIVRQGVAHVPEGRRVFPGLTVRENIMLGASNRKGVKRREIDAETDQMLGYFADLKRLEYALGWTLSGGQLQMVAVARGLMAKPRLLLAGRAVAGAGAADRPAGVPDRLRHQGAGDDGAAGGAERAYGIVSRGSRLMSWRPGGCWCLGSRMTLWANDDVRAAYLGRPQRNRKRTLAGILLTNVFRDVSE